MKYSVLVVDSDENILNRMRFALMQYDFIIHTASSLEDAIILISSHEINFVVVEINIKNGNGIELIKKLKTISPLTYVIIFTSHPTLENTILALKQGVSDYIIKDCNNYSEVIESIQRISEKENSITVTKIKNNESKQIFENNLISKSFSMQKVLSLIKCVADKKTTIILRGETGTGKSAISQIIHDLSLRRDKPLIKVNCAAIPEQLLESELFGYERGAFTGANSTKPGRFEIADGGTIFLDEIGDISSIMQVKLLRVLQEKEFEHLGGTKTLKSDVRVIAATNKNLEQMVTQGTFREDLYYRLNVVPVVIPPLRERKEDIEDLSKFFVGKYASIYDLPIKEISNEVLHRFIQYEWPGNIRQLENLMERCMVINSNPIINIQDLPESINKSENISLSFLEKEKIIDALKKSLGNKTKAAEILKISRKTLYRKIIEYDIVT